MTNERDTDARAITRRAALGAIGAAAGATLAFGCGSETPTSPSTITSGTTSPTTTTNAACAVTPTETVGPYPSRADFFRSDIRGSKSGDYSQYGSQTAATFLRGIQTTNAAGEVTFTTIYPGWYQGRATHIHAEVTVNGRSIKVTQIAFPEAINNAVHTSGAYASRGANPMSNLSDGIFADSLSSELVTPAGSPASGYNVTFQLGVSA